MPDRRRKRDPDGSSDGAAAAASAGGDDGKPTPSKRGKVSWTDEEDQALISAVKEEHGPNGDDGEEDWDSISESLNIGKSAVQCFKRYIQLTGDDSAGSGAAGVVP